MTKYLGGRLLSGMLMAVNAVYPALGGGRTFRRVRGIAKCRA
ncbi:MAG: hypothetical protein WBA02_01425 [Jannaschia helgolandensis]|nr:hypothetical protein [Jannaschia helgolandensis]